MIGEQEIRRARGCGTVAGAVEFPRRDECLGAEGEVAGRLLRRETAEGAAVRQDDDAAVVGLIDADGFAVVDPRVLGFRQRRRETEGDLGHLVQGIGVDVVEAVVEAHDGFEDVECALRDLSGALQLGKEGGCREGVLLLLWLICWD